MNVDQLLIAAESLVASIKAHRDAEHGATGPVSPPPPPPSHPPPPPSPVGGTKDARHKQNFIALMAENENYAYRYLSMGQTTQWANATATKAWISQQFRNATEEHNWKMRGDASGGLGYPEPFLSILAKAQWAEQGA